MQKVALRFSEYMASLPPYRFEAGDVIEVDDSWAEQLVSRGLANKAKSGAKTVNELRAESGRMSYEQRADIERAERDRQRAVLQAQIAELDSQDARYANAAAPDESEGHHSDMVTREGTGAAADKPAPASTPPPGRKV